MFLAYLFMGVTSGMVAFLTTLLMGQTLASAALAYVSVSAAVAVALMLTYALISVLRQRTGTPRGGGRDFTANGTLSI